MFGLAIPKVVFQNTIDGPKAVLPIDFLALIVGAAVIRYADLVESYARDPRKSGGDFGFKTKAVFFQGQTLSNGGSNHFVTSLHIRQVEVGQTVAQKREKFVSNRMPKEEDPVGVASHKARSVDGIGPPVLERGQQQSKFLGIVFEVRILDHNVREGSHGQAGSQGMSLALVAVQMPYPEGALGVLGPVFVQEGPGLIAGAVIDHNHFSSQIIR